MRRGKTGLREAIRSLERVHRAEAEAGSFLPGERVRVALPP